MGQITLNNLSNANVYVSGNCKLGQIEEGKLPTIKFKMIDHKALGMVGTIKLPAGIEALEGELKWNSFYSDVWGELLNPWVALPLQIRGSLETYSPQGRTVEAPYVVLLTATFSEVPTGDFKQHDKAEFTSKFNATYIKTQVDGKDVLEFDAMANIYKIKGVDQLAKYRQNIGG